MLIWLPLSVLLTAGAVLASIALFRQVEPQARGPYGWSTEAKVGGWAAAVTAAAIILLTTLGFYPFGAEYHQWQPTEGTVAQIDHRLIGNGSGGMEDKFVVRFEGSSQQYGCDDTRCAGVREGDFLSLSCKRVWQFTGTDGYDCRFFSTEAAR